MSLNQKYTWKDFLKENPDFKKKEIKRTSSEATKAFEAAFKKHVKEYLKNRLEKIETQKTRSEKTKNALAQKRQKVTQKKDWSKVHTLDVSIGRQDAWTSRLNKQTERTKTLQKNF